MAMIASIDHERKENVKSACPGCSETVGSWEGQCWAVREIAGGLNILEGPSISVAGD